MTLRSALAGTADLYFSIIDLSTPILYHLANILIIQLNSKENLICIYNVKNAECLASIKLQDCKKITSESQLLHFCQSYAKLKIANRAQIIGQGIRTSNSFFNQLPIELNAKIAGLSGELILSESQSEKIARNHFMKRYSE